MGSTKVRGAEMRPTLSGRRPRRAAAACGALFALGIVVGDDLINRAGEPPTPLDHQGDSLGAVEAYLDSAAEAATSGNYWIGRGIGLLAMVALLVFSAYVARQIRAREERSGLLSGVALAAGGVAAGMGLVSGMAQFAAVSRAGEGIDLEVARALLDLSSLVFVAMWLPLAVLMAVLAMAGRRHGLLPRWLANTTGVLAAVLLVGLATLPASSGGFVGIVLAFLWFIVASAVLVRRAS